VPGSRSAGTAVLAAAVLLGAGGMAGFLLRPSAAPAELQTAADLTSAPVGNEELTDERTVKISLKRSAAAPLLAGLTGRVTSTACRVGEPLESGRVVARIDATPLIALATSMPLYRDLVEGAQGDDVKALQRELARLGYPVAASGTFDTRTTAAVKKLKKKSGMDSPDGTVVAGQFLWLPAPSVVPDSCELVPGAFTAPGQLFAKVPAALTAIVVSAMPEGATPGPRLMRVFGVTGPLGAGGTVTDPGFLAKVAATREYGQATATDKDAELTAVVTLKDPLRTLKVPPGAVFGVEGDTGCVQSEATAYPVKIVGSRLGATLVTPVGEAPSRVALGTSITLKACG